MTDLVATVTWTDEKALTFARACLQIGSDVENPALRQLARAVVRLCDRVKALTIDHDDRLVLFAFVADRTAAEAWPATCEAIERVLRKYEAL